MTKESVQKMPYNVDMKILDKILAELSHTGEKGMGITQMWTNIGEVKNLNKSYSLNMAKFLGLVETQGNTVKLTSQGRLAIISNESKRKEMFAKNLPEKYEAMYKWIKFRPKQQMLSGDLKTEYFKTYGDISSKLLLERVIATFMKYLEHIGLAQCAGKGQGAKIILTDFGQRLLDLPIYQRGTLEKPGITASPLKDETLPPENEENAAEHPIKISSPGRFPFFHDIRSESDWKVIDSFVESIKEDWKKKTNPRKSQTGK